jgi:hypothetical protein
MGVMTVLVPARFITLMGHFIACVLVFWTRGDNVRAGLPLQYAQVDFERAQASCARTQSRAPLRPARRAHLFALVTASPPPPTLPAPVLPVPRRARALTLSAPLAPPFGPSPWPLLLGAG